MSKTFRPYDPDQQLLLPAALQEWLPPDHLAYFICDVVDQLDLAAITARYQGEERGSPPYHPRMMVKVLLYGYCTGVASSRRIAQRLHEDLAFRVVAANNTPDFRTISDFRKDHLKALADLFHQVLELCRRVGLVKLGHVALDSTKVRANASKHKAMSYGRMKEKEDQLEAEGVVLYLGPAAVEALLAIRPEEAVIDAVTPVFNLHPDTIRRRLQQAARADGLPKEPGKAAIRLCWDVVRRPPGWCYALRTPLFLTGRAPLQRGDESHGKVGPDAAQDQGHEEQGRVRRQGRRCHPERLHRQGRSGRRPIGRDPSGHIPAVSPGQPPWLGNRAGRRAGGNDVKRTAGDSG